MTWKDIKDKIESLGIKDESIIDYVDIDCRVYTEIEDIVVNKNGEEWIIENV